MQKIKKIWGYIIRFLGYANCGAGSKEFLIYMSVNLSFLFVGIFLSGIAFYQGVYLETDSILIRNRQIMSSVLYVLWFLTLPIGSDSKEKVLLRLAFSCGALLIFSLDLSYFILRTPTKQHTTIDLMLLIPSILTVAYFIYIIGSFTKKIINQIHYIFKEITKSNATSGLQKTLEGITSVVLALTALIIGVSGFAISFKEVVMNIAG